MESVVIMWKVTYYKSLLLHSFNSLFPGQPGQAGPGKVKPVWIYMRQEMMGFWDVVASAGPYADNLHLASDK